MRSKAIYVLSVLAIILEVKNLHAMLLPVPDDPMLYFQLAAAFTAFTCFAAALAASILYLVEGDFWYDSLAVAITEVSIAFALSYLVLRTAIDEPSRRARLSAVFSIFAFADVPIVWYAEGAGSTLRGQVQSTVYWNWVALLMVASILVLLRFRQEEMRREIDGLRRLAHAV